MSLATSRNHVVAALAILAGAAIGYLVAGRTSGHEHLEEVARSLVPAGVEVLSTSRNTGHALVVGAPSATVDIRASEEELVDSVTAKGWDLAARQVYPGGVVLHARREGLQADIRVLQSGEAAIEVEDAPPPAAERFGLVAVGGVAAYAALAGARRVFSRGRKSSDGS